MDMSLSKEQLALQDMARKFVNRHVTPYARDWDRAEEIDRSIITHLGNAGFLGMTIPEEAGGSGGSHLDYCLVLEELARGDSSVRGIVSVSLGLVAKSIVTYGDDQQKERWLEPLLTGRAVGCFGLTEPGTGSDAGALTTRARREGETYVIDGSKMFITNGTWADVILLFARTSDEGAQGISAFLLPTDTPGVSRTSVKGKLGLRGQSTAEFGFDHVVVPASCLVGGEGRGMSIAMSALAKGRVSVAAGCVGIAAGAQAAALEYAKQRTQFGRSIAEYQLVQRMLADMAVETDAARLMTWRVADLIDRGEDFATQASMAKYLASEVAVRVANTALQVFGGYGYIDEFPAEKYVRDARVMTLYEGTSQIQQLLIGRALTGVQAFT